MERVYFDRVRTMVRVFTSRQVHGVPGEGRPGDLVLEMQVRIDEEGKLLDATVTKSSGNAAFDSAVLAELKERAVILSRPPRELRELVSKQGVRVLIETTAAIERRQAAEAAEEEKKQAEEDRKRRAWSTRCRVDELTDKRTCAAIALSDEDDKFTILGSDPEGKDLLLVVGEMDFPGRLEQVLRVDDLKAIEHHPANKQRFKTSATLIQQMLKGQVVRFKYSKWPEGERRGQISLEGFPAAHAELLRRLAAADSAKQ